MKRIIIALLAVAVCGAFTTASAAKKNPKFKKGKQVQVVTATDTLSFAAGSSMTNGLMNYLKQQYDVDEAQMDAFVKGIEDAFAKGDKDDERAYAVGATVAHMIRAKMYPGINKEFDDKINPDLFVQGFISAVLNDTTVMTHKAADKYYRAKVDEKKKAAIDATRKAGEAFLAENATKEGVITTPSGLQYKILKQGEGDIPALIDEVEVIYEGRLIDGTVFDATSQHKGQKTDKFRADRVIKGWTEALTMMPAGSKWQLYIPNDLAYGDRAAGKIQPGSALIFDIELVGFKKNAPKKK